jgi:hypothetical protein
MSWRNYFWGRASGRRREAFERVHLTLPGWTENTPTKELRIWRDADGDVLSLASSQEPIPHFDGADTAQVRSWCRGLAQSRDAGLIEVHTLNDSFDFIYKRLDIPAYVYTGMLFVRAKETWLIWTMVAGERGMTGVREAIVTATLISEGKLKPQEYELHWAHDPYESAYSGVDRSALRSLSDDESYDEQFPLHPLSKVRRTLAALPSNVECDSLRTRSGSER